MGRLVNGTWTTKLYTTKSADGKFIRKEARFRSWITPDGAAGSSGVAGFKAESGRYHLYVSYACPWAHRTLIFRQLKSLEAHISISVVHPDMLDDGWTFQTDDHGATGDTLMGQEFVRDIYLASDRDITSRVTVPILWDKTRRTIVSNESSEIIRMFNSAFDAITGNADDFWPKAMRDQIEVVNQRIYSGLNNGVYKAGFASTQTAYDEAATGVFETLDWIESRLADTRYLMGDLITEADWRLVTTLFRFDSVYNQHFKCNRNRLIDYPNLWAYTRELYQWKDIAKTVNMDHIVRHYHHSHGTINRHRIIPINPVINWTQPHGRG